MWEMGKIDICGMYWKLLTFPSSSWVWFKSGDCCYRKLHGITHLKMNFQAFSALVWQLLKFCIKFNHCNADDAELVGFF